MASVFPGSLLLQPDLDVLLPSGRYSDGLLPGLVSGGCCLDDVVAGVEEQRGKFAVAVGDPQASFRG